MPRASRRYLDGVHDSETELQMVRRHVNQGDVILARRHAIIQGLTAWEAQHPQHRTLPHDRRNFPAEAGHSPKSVYVSSC
jgi:hypothetical protein